LPLIGSRDERAHPVDTLCHVLVYTLRGEKYCKGEELEKWKGRVLSGRPLARDQAVLLRVTGKFHVVLE
jgi:hypothetical protein